MDAGIDSQLLILSFELKFFVCRHVSMWGFQNTVRLSVPWEKKSPYLRQYQFYSSNWYINGKVLETQINIWFYFQKNAFPSVSAVMFCGQFLAYTVHIDRSAFLCNP